MISSYLKLVSSTLLFIATAFCLGAAILTWNGALNTETSSEGKIQRAIPPSLFAQKEEAYANFGSPILSLEYVAPRLHLPDLRPYLVYLGKNGRPDIPSEEKELHFTLQGIKELVPIKPGQKVYLTFDKKSASSCKYAFAPWNLPSSIWFTARAEGGETEITVGMEGENWAENDGNRVFKLQERESVRQQLHSPIWEIGKFRVDSTLLARQKARWMGVDQFFERHGGEEFSDRAGKQRIDFGEGEDSYSVFIGLNDYLVWDGKVWEAVIPGPASVDKPLLQVKKVEDRVMALELWDKEGKAKVAMNLVRTPEPFSSAPLAHDFKFLGSRTKSQVVCQMRDVRMMLRPNDWLIFIGEGWKKLDSLADIDAYVDRKLVGPLFVYEGLLKKDDKTVLVGTLFNPSRTETKEVELALISMSGKNDPRTDPLHPPAEGGMPPSPANPITFHHE
jgi:hypothetical protein